MMKCIKAYRAYSSKMFRVLINLLTVGFAILWALLGFAIDITPFLMIPCIYIMTMMIFDFFLFGGLLNKHGRISEYFKSSTAGKSVLTQAVKGDILLHAVRMFFLLIVWPIALEFIVIPEVDPMPLGPGFIVFVASVYCAALASLTGIEIIGRIIGKTFQMYILIMYVLMIPVSILTMIPSLTFVFAGTFIVPVLAVLVIVYAALAIALYYASVAITKRSYDQKLTDTY